MPRPQSAPGADSTETHSGPATTDGSPARRTGRRTATVVCLLVVLVLVAAGIVNQPWKPSVSGDSKTTCLYTKDDVSTLQQMQAKLGRPLTCAVLFNDSADNWAQWADPWFIHAPKSEPQYQWPAWAAADGKRITVVTQSLIPKEVPADWRTRGAAGEYDSYIVTLGRNLVAAGLGRAIIRLGHEANGNWYGDNIGTTAADHAAWRAYWARVSSVIKSVPGSHFELDWTVAAGTAPTPFADYYPGDAAVDIIGADVYDSTKAGDRQQPARWRHELSAPCGVGALLNFAAQHDKPASIPEWGLISGANPAGDGDDPYFVNQIADLVKQHRVRYQGYFETQPATGIFGASPLSLAAWVARYGPSGDARGQ